MLINHTGRSGSIVLELGLSLALVVGVGYGVYTVQHPHLTRAQQITASLQQ